MNRQGQSATAGTFSSNDPAMDAARGALAGFDIAPHEISRNEMTLETAFQEIDLLQRETLELRVVVDLLKIRLGHLESKNGR